MLHYCLLPVFMLIAPDNYGSERVEKVENFAAEKWEMVKNSKGVQSFVRWIISSDGCRTRERKGEMTVNCAMEDAVHMISDPSEIKSWMNGISENYILERSGASEWYTYTLFNIPWPFEKRDLVSRYRITRNPSGWSVTISIVSSENDFPLKPDISRLSDYRANWTITSKGENITGISFSAFSNSPLLFPRYIQDPVMEKMFHNNLVRLKEKLSE